MTISDGSSASYYELPCWAQELQDLIRYKNLNGAQAEMFRALYRGSEAAHSDEQRQAKKLLCYAVDEIVRTHFPEQSFKGLRDRVFGVLFNWEGELLPPPVHILPEGMIAKFHDSYWLSQFHVAELLHTAQQDSPQAEQALKDLTTLCEAKP